MKAVAVYLKLKLKEKIENNFFEVSSRNRATCWLLEITVIFRDNDIQIFLNGDVLLCPLARDSKPIRLLEIPTSPNSYMLMLIMSPLG